MRWGTTLALLGLAGCWHTSSYTCASSVECVQGGIHGVCEPQGYCAFPDPSCPGGDRFENNAGMGLAGTCAMNSSGNDGGVDVPIDAPPACGEVGMACCQGEGAACIENAFCQGGTCQQCAIDIAIGQRHSCVIKYDGTVWCSGRNDRGQLGTGVIGGADTSTRQQVRDNSNNVVADATLIRAGAAHNCILRANGAVWCWGKNDDGQLADGTSSTNRGAAVPATRASDSTALTGFVDLAMTHDTTCAVDNAGGAWCFGDNALGQVGDGTTTTPRTRAVPILVAAAGAPVTGVAAITASDDDHVCYRTTGDAIYCWGHNTSGQVGDNTVVNKLSPVHVFDATQVAAGHAFNCAVRSDSSLWCWGEGGRGRLGIGADQGNQLVATNTLTSAGGTAFSNVTQVAAAGVTCARTSDGSAWCWGTNAHGQTGTGIGTYFPMPVIYDNGAPVKNVKKLVVGYATSCAFLDSGNLVCWGRNSEGQLGDGTFASRNVAAPVKVSCP